MSKTRGFSLTDSTPRQQYDSSHTPTGLDPMSVHSRVTDEPNEAFLEFVSGSRIPRGRSRPDNFLIVKRGSKYRVHEDGSSYSYSGPTAAHVKLGPMVRRYDPDAGVQEGRPATFPTPQDAEAYIKTWL